MAPLVYWDQRESVAVRIELPDEFDRVVSQILAKKRIVNGDRDGSLRNASRYKMYNKTTEFKSSNIISIQCTYLLTYSLITTSLSHFPGLRESRSVSQTRRQSCC
jgi:hypothetical protein